ncbi:MAG: hypothetical protein M3463_11890 [Verrucomicrobiota bacterium]|nr:hypothetical protein [Verrucomicrobiota bacterium]
MRHLVVIPASGMGNRLRAIASARRLCGLLQARCSVVWDWGDIDQFFAPIPDVEIVRSRLSTVATRIVHRPMHVDPTRTVDVSVETLEVRSQYVFWGSHESEIELFEIREYLPSLSARLQEIVEEFSANHLKNAVGLHLRRTDNKKAIEVSRDALFFSEARALVSVGKKLFLATDNATTEAAMQKLFGDAIITYPKRQALDRRWPRPFNQTAAEDDLIDLFLLSRTEYILGSYWSSFSGVAMALNGSERCRILKNIEPAA